ncbi:zinc-finger double domain-containing protein [Ditylenchus destructor]|nr:zinc-finger double domain-containing protein [Ditylenchus destructor]
MSSHNIPDKVTPEFTANVSGTNVPPRFNSIPSIFPQMPFLPPMMPPLAMFPSNPLVRHFLSGAINNSPWMRPWLLASMFNNSVRNNGPCSSNFCMSQNAPMFSMAPITDQITVSKSDQKRRHDVKNHPFSVQNVFLSDNSNKSDHQVITSDVKQEEENLLPLPIPCAVSSSTSFHALFYDGQLTLQPGQVIQISKPQRKMCHTTASASEANVCGDSNKVLRLIRRGDEIVLLFGKTSESQTSESNKKLMKKIWKKVPTKEDIGSTTSSQNQMEHVYIGGEAMLNTDESLPGYECQRCGKMFTYAYYRDKHLKYTRCVDNGDRKFPCQLCSRSFEKRDRLRIHVLHVHENHRPHACSVCGKAFSQSSSLNKHLRVHSGERPYHCPHCTKSFTASSILRTHIRQHSGEKPFKCSFCGKSFASHAAHDSHVRRTHYDEASSTSSFRKHQTYIKP